MYFIIIVIGIVANKCDLYNNEQVSTNEGKQFAKETKCLFFETSCKSGVNVNEMFYQIAVAYNNRIHRRPYIEGVPFEDDDIIDLKAKGIILQKPINKKKKCCGKSK